MTLIDKYPEFKERKFNQIYIQTQPCFLAEDIEEILDKHFIRKDNVLQGTLFGLEFDKIAHLIHKYKEEGYYPEELISNFISKEKVIDAIDKLERSETRKNQIKKELGLE